MKSKTTLEQWHVFHAVVEYGGYAQAAEALHRSQSSVSYTVAKLQQQLGLELLRIAGRKAVLTDVGRALLRQSSHLLDDAQQLEQLAQGLEQGWEAEIFLVVDAAFPNPWLMQALKKFAPISHGTRVQLDQVVLSGAEDAIRSGQADIVITSQIPNNYLGDSITSIEFIAVAHPDHPLNRLHRNITHADLKKELQLVVRDSSLQHRSDSGWLGADHRWTVSSIDTAIHTASEGLGFCWLPRHSIEQQLQQGLLQPLNLTSGQSYIINLYLVIIKSESAGPATQTLSRLLIQSTQD
ncbi:MAG: LysR family transcriptional regulator [Gammaproteobacteria bacterium]|nr:LysR family transcriptional regulator [Gammaproteobacteria bacterium]